MKVDDMRRYLRRPLQVELEIGLRKAHAAVFFDSKDLSRGGTFMQAEFLLDVGEEFTVRFRLPNNRKHVITVRGRVVWVTRGSADADKPHSGMGVQFVDLAPEDGALIDAYLARM